MDLICTSYDLEGSNISQDAAITNPSAITAPAEADDSADLVLTQGLRTTVIAILTVLRNNGLIAT